MEAQIKQFEKFTKDNELKRNNAFKKITEEQKARNHMVKFDDVTIQEEEIETLKQTMELLKLDKKGYEIKLSTVNQN